MTEKSHDKSKVYQFENKEWLDSLQFIMDEEGPERVKEILDRLTAKAQQAGISTSFSRNTAYINTISAEEEEKYPGDLELEKKIKSLVRWNAMAMVVKANREESGIGGHISTYASAATLFEVGFNHFFKGGDLPDLVYFQGHASPGIYARSFLEGRFAEKDLVNFRRELDPEGGLSSYPHPRLMPDYWKFPTVSMGLGPIQAIYQARFAKYLEDRKLKEPTDQKIWAFLGDGEMDEPESLGAITVASREELDNLIFVINCNLQRLDGPVRGNGKTIQELEAAFKGAGWNVIKVVWGSEWDQLLEKDHSGVLKKRMEETVDGQYQKYVVEGGAYIRKDFFGAYPELKEMVEDLSDEELEKMKRGGHDPVKVYNAYKKAVEFKEGPTVILAKTVKGYGLGEAGEGRNVTHQQKKLNEDELKTFRKRFDIPIPEKQLSKAPFYRPRDDSEEIEYLKQRRKDLGGQLPIRTQTIQHLKNIPDKAFKEFRESSGDREVATTMVIVQLMSKLMKDKEIGKLVVPIVPDESRTFGMDALFRQAGIYSHVGQKYEPVDKESLLFYKEAKNGAILEEGITEAGSISSFIAAGTAHTTYELNTIPFFIFYSMFGFQRIGDLVWAAADARTRGFMIGGTSGRTTLAGEGLQHQDGQSHLYAFAYPNIMAYDPTYAYEIAVIIKDGIRRMYQEGEDIFYYITVMNEKYTMPELPKGVEEGILKGMYRYRKSKGKKTDLHLLGSGAIFREVLEAADWLEENFNLSIDVWSVTSYKALYDNAIAVERNNRISANGKTQKNYIQECFGDNNEIFVAATDYLKAIPLTVSQWFPGTFTALGTDGFGRSDNRIRLRDFFEVDYRYIAHAALKSLKNHNKIESKELKKAVKELEIDSDKLYPHQ